MFIIPFLILITIIVLSSFGCGGAPVNSAANTNKNVNTNATVNAVPANVQPEPTISPMPPPANAAGIQSNTTTVQKGATTRPPGFENPADIRKPFKPGATPTPGIPSPAEIQKMLGKPPSNVNSAPMKGSEVPMMKSNKKLGGKP